MLRARRGGVLGFMLRRYLVFCCVSCRMFISLSREQARSERGGGEIS